MSFIFVKMSNHQIFNVKINSLYEINELLGLPNRRSKNDNADQIIDKLETDYDYGGEFNTHYIREFIKVKQMIQPKGVVIDDGLAKYVRDIKLDDIIDTDDEKYHIDEKAYNRLINPKYNNEVIQRAIERQAMAQAIGPSATLNEFIDMQTDDDEINDTQNINEQNNFLTDKDAMTEQQPQRPPRPIKQLPEYTRQSGSHKKVGMNELANIVLNMQRDFKRVAGALSVQGAQNIVNKHNATAKPSAYWRVQHEDINGDNIPDILIRNSKNEPIVVNGWTTKRSDYPARYKYYQAYPTREERKEHPYPEYKRDELYQYQYDDENVDVHKRGNVTSFNEQAFPAHWKLSNYNVDSSPRKRLGAYQRFQRYILKSPLEFIVNHFANQRLLPVPWSTKVSDIAKVTGKLWNKWILQNVADRYGKQYNDPQFVKYKNKKDGKAEIDDCVTAFYYHLNETGNGWTEEQRNNLENRFDQDIADTLERVLRHEEELQAHHYATFEQRQHNVHNAETEGDFGEWE